MNTKVFLNRASWVILVFLFIPAGAVQASKDAVPGDQVYPIKLILEDALLLMMKPSSAATSDMEMKFTKRRLLEVEKVADTPFAIKSLKSLNEQVADTTDSIERVKNLDKQTELVSEYIQTLQETQASLKQQQALVTNQVVNNYYYYDDSPGNDDAAQAEIQRQLEETQAEIAAEIERLRQVALENERIRQQQIEDDAAAARAAQQQQAEDDAAAARAAAQQQQEAEDAAAVAPALSAPAAIVVPATIEEDEAESVEEDHDNRGSDNNNAGGNSNH